MNKYIIIILALVVGIGIGYFFGYDQGWENSKDDLVSKVSTFSECVVAGNPVMESYPRQCRHNNQTFVEEIGNELEKGDLIRIVNPRPNQLISSPVEIEGEARGVWYFEATFPVILTDWDGKIIAESYAIADGDWMTEDFVPFSANLEFESPVFENASENHFSRRGALILQKSNASGLPEHDDALEIPARF